MAIATRGLPCASVVMSTTERAAEQSYRERLARALAVAMEDRGITQGELARRTGIKQQVVSKMLASNQRIYVDQLALIAKAIEVPAEWLIRAPGGPPPQLGDVRRREELERIIARIGLEQAYDRLIIAASPVAPGPETKSAPRHRVLRQRARPDLVDRLAADPAEHDDA